MNSFYIYTNTMLSFQGLNVKLLFIYFSFLHSEHPVLCFIYKKLSE